MNDALDIEFRERVVKMREYCEGALFRTFYCIYDTNYRHWMSTEPFDGMLWTKDVKLRQEFISRRAAKDQLRALRERREQEGERRPGLSQIRSSMADVTTYTPSPLLLEILEEMGAA